MKSINNRNVDSENPFCLTFSDVDTYIIEEGNENKCLLFALTKNNKKVLGIYRKLWNEIKNQIETINGSKSIKHKKYFMRTRFNSDGDLPLGKILSTAILSILVKPLFQNRNSYYPQTHITKCEYEGEYEL